MPMFSNIVRFGSFVSKVRLILLNFADDAMCLIGSRFQSDDFEDSTLGCVADLLKMWLFYTKRQVGRVIHSI